MKKKTFIKSNFHYHGNDIIRIMKIYTTNHSHYHLLLILLTKRAVEVIESKIPIHKESAGASSIVIEIFGQINLVMLCNMTSTRYKHGKQKQARPGITERFQNFSLQTPEIYNFQI